MQLGRKVPKYPPNVGIGQAEPFPGDLGDLFAPLFDRVFKVKDIALHIEVGSVLDLDGPAVAQRGDERFFDDSHLPAVRSSDRHRIADGQQAFLDGAERIAVQVFEYQRLADAQDLAVHFEGAFPCFVLDPEIISNGDQVLAYFVACGHKSFLSSFGKV
jgi:hypothetical protein